MTIGFIRLSVSYLDQGYFSGGGSITRGGKYEILFNFLSFYSLSLLQSSLGSYTPFGTSINNNEFRLRLDGHKPGTEDKPANLRGK